MAKTTNNPPVAPDPNAPAVPPPAGDNPPAPAGSTSAPTATLPGGDGSDNPKPTEPPPTPPPTEESAVVSTGNKPNNSGFIARQAMVDAISRGGSVLHRGTLINRVDALPSESDLARESGNTDQMQQAQRDNEARIKQLTAENDKLKQTIAKSKAGGAQLPK